MNVKEKLTGYLRQLKEMSDFLNTLDKVDAGDESLNDWIEEAGVRLFDAASYISEIIGRETLSVEFCERSNFKI